MSIFSILKEENCCKSADKTTIIYKDECLYCFDSVDSKEGLFICMNTFIGVCKEHLNIFYNKSPKNRLFLNLKIEKKLKKVKEIIKNDENEYKNLLKEAFSVNNYEIIELNKLILLPEFEIIDLESKEIDGDKIKACLESILSGDSVAKSLERGIKSECWAGESLCDSEVALKLVQLDNGVKVAPGGWKCNFCNLTTNLWMNLTDGTILCGRKFFDGSGGNNHAIEYFQKTKYPLAVKLGTITPKSADVFSYVEDDMVIDPLLGQHLAHFGIDIMTMKKSDKSMEEMALEKIKLNREQMAIMEADSNQEIISGPGLIGIVNTGNSCYINSVFQVLFSLKPFQCLYRDNYKVFIERHSVTEDVNDFRCQLSKLAYYLFNEKYSHIPPEDKSDDAQKIVPHLLRYIIGKGHQDFSTKQQQDAFEYLIHVLNFVKADIKKYGVEDGRNPLESVEFKVEDRIFCDTTGTVKYQQRDEFVLSLSIPMDKAINSEDIKSVEKKRESDPLRKEDEEIVRPIVHLQSCLDLFIEQNLIQDYNVNGTPGIAFQSSKLKTFPDYLWIHLKRFTVGSDWTPKKLDVEIEVPDQIDLSAMQAKGLQPHETEMKDVSKAEPKVELSQCLIDELLLMGFPTNACKKAVFLTGNSSLEEAANWLMLHIGEADFEELPPQLLQSGAKNDVEMCDESDIDMMVNMGFNRKQAITALQETGNLERAADWAFSHPEEMREMEVNVSNQEKDIERCELSNGEPQYTLSGLISHMGNNAHVGHYVSHVKQTDGSWVLFNDESVQKSLNPPKKFAYLYLFKRNT